MDALQAELGIAILTKYNRRMKQLLNELHELEERYNELESKNGVRRAIRSPVFAKRIDKLERLQALEKQVHAELVLLGLEEEHALRRSAWR